MEAISQADFILNNQHWICPVHFLPEEVETQEVVMCCKDTVVEPL